MKKSLVGAIVPLLFFAGSVMLLSNSPTVSANEVQTKGKVCGNLSAPCKPPTQTVKEPLFEACDLTFQLPQQLEWQTNYYSADFYAIILKSRRAIKDDGPDSRTPCSGFFTENERGSVQKLFPSNKVFASRFGCYGHAIAYTNTNADYNFMALYAGETITDAKVLLQKVKALGFRDANIRKMQVVLLYGN